MLIITQREFRANQKKYFDKASTETVIIPRKGKKPILIKEWEEKDMPNNEELQAIKEGLEDIKNGRITFVNPSNVWESIE